MEANNLRIIANQILQDQRYQTVPVDLKKAIANRDLLHWVNSFGVQWDVACCWHQPLGSECSEKMLQEMLKRYFVGVNRKVYKGVKGVVRQLPRFITFEKKGEVGWHAHGMIATPSHMEASDLISLLEQDWLDWNSGPKNKFSNYLFWGQNIQGNYADYALKNISSNMYKRDGDETAFVDVINTYRP